MFSCGPRPQLSHSIERYEPDNLERSARRGAGPFLRRNLAHASGRFPRLCTQLRQVSRRRCSLGRPGVCLDCSVEGRQVPSKGVVDGRCPYAAERLLAGIRIGLDGGFDRLIGPHESVDCRFSAAHGIAQQIDPERLVRLLGHILGGPLPKPVLGDRRDVAHRLTMPLSFQKRAFGDHRPCGAPAAALGDIGREGRDAGSATGQGVDMLV